MAPWVKLSAMKPRLDHVGLDVSDYATSKAFYETALAPLGIVTGSFTEAEGSDIGPMLADGHPGLGLNQDGTR